MEKQVWIESGEHRLEAMYNPVSNAKGAALITHPHPLYGGNMDNPVVMALARAFAGKHMATLRFNFRGTGQSTGHHDGGRGEAMDVAAALDWLALPCCCLAGYSFGARVNAEFMAMDKGRRVSDHIMVSPPVAFMSFAGLPSICRTGLVVTGKRDEIAPPDKVQDQLTKWGISPEFRVLPGCDHFYGGCLETLSRVVDAYLESSG